MVLDDLPLNQLNVATKRFVRESPKLVDNVFQQGTTARIMQKKCMQKFNGGRLIQENFWYDALPGGPTSPTAELNITQPQVEQAMQFRIKYYFVGITLLKTEIQVENTGPKMIFPIIKSRTENAYATMGAFMELGLFLNGINANYTFNVNGFPEMLNDGSTASWDGNTYANYGNLAR